MATSRSEQATLRDESDIDGDRRTRPYESDLDQEKDRIDTPPNRTSADERAENRDRVQADSTKLGDEKAPAPASGPPIPGGTPPDGGLQAWMQVAGAFM